jgi:ribosomal-protein-alanine N-acetyltransferase
VAHIETERLILRTWMPGDSAALFAINTDPEINRYLPIVHQPTLESTMRWIDWAIEEQEREGFSLWPVIRKDTGALIGRCGLHRMENGDVEVAWVLARDQWGHGYATEAARASIDYGLRVMKMKKLVALIFPLNSASVAVANRCGMEFDRVVRAYKRELLKYVTAS